MTVDLISPVIDAAVARLTTELQPILDDINALVTDGATLDTPVAIHDYMPPLRQLTTFPTIGIQDGPTTFQDDIGSSATGVHVLSVVVFVSDLDPRKLALRLRRWEKALVRCVMSGRALGPAWGTVLRRVEPGPTLGRKENPEEKVSWVAMTLQAKTDEDF